MESFCTFNEVLDTALRNTEEDLPHPLWVVPWSEAEELVADGVTLFDYGPHSEHELVDSTDEVEGEYCGLRIQPPQEPASPIILDGVTIGEVRPRRVYSYIQLRYYGQDNERIAAAFCEALRLSCDPEFCAADDERRRATEHDALVQFARSSYDRNISTLRDEIDARESVMTTNRRAITVAMREIREKQELLDAVLTLRDNDAGEQMIREWERLQGHPRVARCSFGGEQLVVTTTDDLRLHREDTGESRWLGAFVIKFDLSCFDVTMRNLNTRRGGRDHPHIPDGNPCFGGHAEAFTELLGQGELYTVFELLLQYIETLNLADEYGRFGSYWFDVPDERPIEEEVAA